MPTYANGPAGLIPIAGAGFARNRQNLGEVVFVPQTTPVAKTAAAVLTAAELANGLITYNGAAANLTLPTVALLEASLSNAEANDSFEFVVLDLGGAGRPTIITSTGWTLVGSMVNTAASLPATYRARKTADGAWTLYRVA
jgi:hypothetical protein